IRGIRLEDVAVLDAGEVGVRLPIGFHAGAIFLRTDDGDAQLLAVSGDAGLKRRHHVIARHLISRVREPRALGEPSADDAVRAPVGCGLRSLALALLSFVAPARALWAAQAGLDGLRLAVVVARTGRRGWVWLGSWPAIVRRRRGRIHKDDHPFQH